MKIGFLESGMMDFDGDVQGLFSYDGQTLGELRLADSDVIDWNLNQWSGPSLYERLSMDEVMALFARAGELFCSGALPCGDRLQTPEDYAMTFSRLSGAPISAPRRTLKRVKDYFAAMADWLAFQVPLGQLDVLQNGYYHQGSRTIGWVPTGQRVAVMAPANHPSVHLVWSIVSALGYRMAIRPSADDPLTPLRIIQALLSAGLPDDMVQFYPCNHGAVSSLLKGCDAAVLFGGDAIEKRYGHLPRHKVYGPGRSMMLVDENQKDIERIVDVAVESMMRDGGRGCINLSCIVARGNGREIAEAIATQVAKLPIKPPTDSEARIGALKDKARAEAIHQQIEQYLGQSAQDMTQGLRAEPRLCFANNSQYLLPTVVYCKTQSPLIGKEYGFPFITVVDLPDKADWLNASAGALTVSLFSEDMSVFNALVRRADVGKVYWREDCTCDIDFFEPHDGYISDELFIHKAVRLPDSRCVRRSA